MSVEYEVRDDIAVVRFNRPDRYNAIEASLSRATVEALERAGAEARVVVLTGAGKAFCSGADLADLVEAYQAEGPDLFGHLERVFHPMVKALVECPVPTVAAVNGVAAGAGLGMALACDIRIIGASAGLTSAFTAIGLVPDSGTTWWLTGMVGISKALELTLTNRRVDAAEAVRLGLAMEAVGDDLLMGRALEVAGQLADLVPDSLVTTRKLIRSASASTFDQALNAEQAEQGRLGRTPEHLEGVDAFLAKRRPNYRSADAPGR
jgi:2-(1,2-epoxy-1,2-dihydrophenyl)acetyl-CoA isomerase